MLAVLRTYRLMVAVMALLLLVAGSLPLVQHVCAMMRVHQQTDATPCPHHEHEPTTAHTGTPHEAGLHDHAAMHTPAPAERPCPHKTQPQAAPGDCCSIEVQALAVEATRRTGAPRLLVAAPALLMLPKSLTPEAAPLRPTAPQDTGPPPPAHVSLHILYASFLS